MTRRELIRNLSLGMASALLPSLPSRPMRRLQEEYRQFDGQEVLQRIVNKATSENWPSLPIGELMGKVALELRGIPYKGFTLEISKDLEYCVVNLKGLDCVTFFEDTLDIARMLKKGRTTPDDLLAEVRFTRYRGGRMGSFPSRLHYTTDWFVDNEEKGVVKVVTPDLPGAEEFTQKVGIMTQHPERYRQLATHPQYVSEMKLIEDTINGRSLKYLPMDKLEAAEPLLKTGDIIGVTTSEDGIDIAHTGLVLRDETNVAHFMDASSARSRMQVTLEPEISKCLNWSSQLTGVMVARPLF
ncbi:MAG: DUF1460 domain-containing protein [Fimbriimonas sp.]|nr:DUF1460 domain-containing protein [Fimbriimonas sp.]